MSEPKTEVVILVHGTFSFDELGEGTRWWQSGSEFGNFLKQHLTQSEIAFRTVPFYVPPWWKRPFVENDRKRTKERAHFVWSGANSESARMRAARMLLERMDYYNEEKIPFHLIGHSHGGSVLWQALVMSVSRKGENPLPFLKTATTVGTPFLHFGPDFTGLMGLFPLVLLGVLLPMVVAWFGDYWNQSFHSNGRGWQVCFSLLAVYLMGLLWICLALKLLWTWYRKTLVTKTRDPEKEVWRWRATDDVVSTSLALGVATCAALIVYWLLWPNVSKTVFSGPWVSSVLAEMWLCSAFAILIAYVSWTVSPIVEWFRQLRLAQQTQAAWKVFETRIQCFAFTDRDEAIGLLSASSSGLTGQLLPRMSPPGTSDIGPRGIALLRPESEYSRQGIAGWISGNLLLPLMIVKEWVIVPVYNELFVRMFEDFLYAQMVRKAVGLNTPGKCIVDVTDHPMKCLDQSGECAARFPIEAREPILKYVHDRLVSAIDRIREKLFGTTVYGLDLGQIGAGSGLDESLVHTSYFDQTVLRNVLINRIEPGRIKEADAYTLEPAKLAPPDRTNQISDGGPLAGLAPILGFFGFLIRKVLSVAIVCAPVCVLFAVAWGLFYPKSRDYHLHWATEPSTATRYAEETLNASGTSSSIVPSVHWSVARDLCQPNGESSSEFAIRIRDPRKRALFLMRVARKYAQLGDDQTAVRLFSASWKQICDFHLNDLLVSSLAGNLIEAKMYLGEARFKGLIGGLAGNRFESNRTFKELETQLDKQHKDYAERSETFVQLLKWHETAPQSHEVLNWVKRVKASDEIGSASETVDRTLGLMLFGGEISLFSEELAAEVLNQTEVVLKPHCRPETLILPLRNSFNVLIAMAAFDSNSKPALLTQAVATWDRLGEIPDTIGISTEPWIKNIAPLAWALEKSPKLLEKILTRVESFSSELDGQDLQASCFANLARAHGRIGNSLTARYLSEGWGIDCHMQAALGIIEHECQARNVRCTDKLVKVLLTDELFPVR